MRFSFPWKVLAQPSHELAVSMAREEKERVQRQREELGEKGLEEKGRQLKEAMEINDTPCPTDVVSCVPVPGIDCIFFHPLVSVGNHQSHMELAGVAECEKFPLQQLPFFFHLNHIHSSFVEVGRGRGKKRRGRGGGGAGGGGRGEGKREGEKEEQKEGETEKWKAME